MERLIKPARLAAFVVLIIALCAVCVVWLYKLQVIEGAAYYEESLNNVVTTTPVTAARGNILDRYGRVLVSNRECYNLKFDTDKLFALDDPNALILQMVKIVEDCGDAYIDELPVTAEPPFEYTTDMTSVQSTMLQAYLADHDLAPDTSAVELMSYFRTRYDIDNNYSAEDMRIIAGIRYDLNVRYSINTAEYVFVEDASIDLISRLLETGSSAVKVETSFVREYKTQYAAHLLGYIGLMDPQEYEKYSKTGDYGMDAMVGKDGAELAFESYLHGSDGEARITSTANGTVTGTTYTEEPIPGNHVYLTIDIQLQEAAERALESGYARMEAKRESDNLDATNAGKPEDVQEDVQGMALVAVDVKTGEPLAIASYPTFNLSTFLQDYSKLLTEDNNPLFNRALMGAYAPGSTFKPCSAIACLSENIINTESIIRCEGVFTKYADQGYAPQCWIWSDGLTHGDENVTTATRDSCNYFFYTVGDKLGISKLDEYAKDFGLGESTGIELPESTGNMSHPENHYQFAGKDWTYGDTLQAAIGQADSLFTPLQLAEYCATIANGGTRHSASILKGVRSYDYSEEKYEDKDTVLSTVESASYNWSAVQQGMYLVANDPAGSAYQYFFGYQVPVAAKTGTAQLGEDKTNNAIFMCYAPYDDPEIAIAVAVERGGAGSDAAPIAKEVLDTYFSIKNTSNTQEHENTLLK